MLPLEAIGVLAILYIFFMVGTVRAIRAKMAVSRKAKVKPAARELAPETTKGDV